MRTIIFIATLFLFTTNNVAAGGSVAKIAPAPNGIELPQGYKSWQILSTSYRQDNHTVRAILGNEIAVKASRKGDTSPWPNGAIIGKIVWKAKQHENWEKAIVPDKFIHIEFMIKNSKRFKDTGGWGFARWTGQERKPYGESAAFAQECFTCHLPRKEQDYVFTEPPLLP